MPETSRSFAAASRAVREARVFLRTTLQEWSQDGYDFGAPLVLTELVTNAVLHARTPYEVRLALRADELLIEVRDFDERPPRPRHYGMDATTGRGMSMVDSLCSEWGVRTADDGGKVVWALVRSDDRATLDLADDDDLDVLETRPSAPERAHSEGRVTNRATGAHLARHAA